MAGIITTRFIKCVNYLNDNGVIRSLSSFAQEIGTHRQTLNDIMKGRREAKVEHIEQAIQKYYFNPYFIFSGIGEMFDKPDDDTDGLDSNIKLVPIKAQAGYSNHILDPVFQADLPKFRLPLSKFYDGEYVAFEVEGDSMYPTLDEGDVVICTKLAPQYYAHTIKDNKVFVVVTEEEVLVKRLVNNIHTTKSILCLSDNAAYPQITIKSKRIKEMWKVEGALKISLPKLSSGVELSDEAIEKLLMKLK